MCSRYKIGVAAVLVVVAGLEHDVDHVAQRREQLDEGLHHLRLGHGRHQHRHVRLGLVVAIGVVAEAGARHDLEAIRRADRVRQLEVAVAGHAEVGFQLFFRELLETAGGMDRPGVVEDVHKKLL